MLVVAIVISALTDRVRGQAELARRRERRSAALLVLSRRLAATRDAAAIGEAAVSEVAEVFDAQAVVLAPEGVENHALVVRAARIRTFAVEGAELDAAKWVFEHGEAAGNGTATMPNVAGFYLPLTGSRGTVGVLAVRPSARSRLQNPEQIRLLEAFASQTAAAMERANLADETRAAWERVEAEFLRNTLLSSVSHDLRTPLAAISGAAGTLLQADGSLDTVTRRDLTETVLDESRRMERLVSNLLDMTRLESGGLQLKREWQPVAEVVGAALHQMEARLAHREVRVDLPSDLPLVNIDEVSMEQVLVNLLDNAVEYTPPDSALAVMAREGDGRLILEICDRGPGVAPGKEQQIFQKFFRSHESGGRRGIGLGLAICRGIVEAHGGTITAANRPDGGAVFCIQLPVEGAPRVVET
jgi:two-component system sensor histidine kinase KdpD